jgi:hypothetical protein
VLLLGGAIYVLQVPQVTIQITGAPATAFIGNVTVDGNATPISGQIPATLNYRGRHVAFNVLPVSGADPAFRVRLDDQETSGAAGVGGWFDARRVVPDIMLRPLDVEESRRLNGQLRNATAAAQPVLLDESPAQEAAPD